MMFVKIVNQSICLWFTERYRCQKSPPWSQSNDIVILKPIISQKVLCFCFLHTSIRYILCNLGILQCHCHQPCRWWSGTRIPGVISNGIRHRSDQTQYGMSAFVVFIFGNLDPLVTEFFQLFANQELRCLCSRGRFKELVVSAFSRNCKGQ